MIKETLQEIGLSNRECECYLALLEIGVSKVGLIIKKSNIPSSKIYEILEKLMKRGLVTYVIKNNIKHYQASDPKSLIHFLDEKKKNLEEIIPRLISKQNKEIKNEVKIFEGQKAIFSMFNNLIGNASPKENYFIFSISEEEKNESVKLFLKNLAVRRKQKKLDVKVLKNMKYYIKEKHTKVKLKYTNFNLPQGITIFRNFVIYLSWSNSPIAIQIESKDFSNEMKKFFIELWIKAKE